MCVHPVATYVYILVAIICTFCSGNSVHCALFILYSPFFVPCMYYQCSCTSIKRKVQIRSQTKYGFQPSSSARGRWHPWTYARGSFMYACQLHGRSANSIWLSPTHTGSPRGARTGRCFPLGREPSASHAVWMWAHCPLDMARTRVQISIQNSIRVTHPLYRRRSTLCIVSWLWGHLVQCRTLPYAHPLGPLLTHLALHTVICCPNKFYFFVEKKADSIS